MSLAQTLGAGGDRVEDLLSRLVSGQAPPEHIALSHLARLTPAGRVSLPVALVALTEGVVAADKVEPDWLQAVEGRRSAARDGLLAAGREPELEAALHVTTLLAADHWAGDQVTPEGRVAAGAQLWLLTAAVAWALGGADPDPFGPWGDLVAWGLWPVGPSEGRLVLSAGCPAGVRS